MRYILFFMLLVLSANANAKNRKVKIVTTKGTMVVLLSDKTPKHSNNFIKLVKQKFYDSILFHRVIKDFMIQAGDPDTKKSEPGKRYGNGGLNYKIPAEFNTSLFHRRGALAAARNDNPEKESSSCQFYIVQGKIFTDSTLDDVRQKRMGSRTIPAHQLEVYKTIGGAPHLDQNYTVFGMLVKGIEVLNKIAGTERDQYNRPREDIRIIKMRLKKKFLFF